VWKYKFFGIMIVGRSGDSLHLMINNLCVMYFLCVHNTLHAFTHIGYRVLDLSDKLFPEFFN